MIAKILNLFQNPTSEYRGKPFWSWNGKLDQEELIRQIGVMKEMGMGGFFCHSRTGLVTEYLGEEWFSLINACAEEGEKLGLEAWLYDEDRWPSGTAGGLVTENPEYRLKYIRLTITSGNDFVWDDSILAAFAADVDGFAFTNKKRIQNAEEPVKGKTVLSFTIEEMEKSSFYNGFTYLDTMKESATAAFIDMTHKKYMEKCGEKFGKSIHGIFTDEPHRGAVMCGFSVPNQNPEYLTPYTDKLFDEFQLAFGYNLTDYLPELFLWKDGEKVHPVKWQYMELLQRLFLKNFMQPIQDWCRQHKLNLTGHVLHEDSLTAQSSTLGSVMRAYEYMDYPGVDVLGEFNQNYWIVKQISSAARQLGKKNVLSELYGCSGWQMNFESHKAVGDWQALLGVNMRCHHLSWYTMEGEAKRDYPASIFYQSAWYQEYKYIEDYFSRIHVFLSQGEPVCDLLVISPVESIWSMIYPAWSMHMSPIDDTVKQLEQRYCDTFHMLSSAKIDFDYGDEEMLSRLYSIETDKTGVHLKVGKASYDTVLISGMLTIRKSTLDILNAFTKAGGKVIIAGQEPSYVDAQKSKEIKALSAVRTAYEQTELLSAIAKNELIIVTDQHGQAIPNIFVQMRKTEKEYLIAVMNVNRQSGYETVTLCINLPGYLEQWNARSGEVFQHGYFPDKAELKFSVARSEELFFVLSNADNKYPKLPLYETAEVLPIKDRFLFSLSEPNVCVLDFAKYRIDGEDWNTSDEILKVDRKIRKHYKLSYRDGEMIQPWYSGKQETKQLGKVELEFEFFTENLKKSIDLAIETPDRFTIFVNNIKIENKAKDQRWIDSCFKIIPIREDYLKPGRNTISLHCDFKEDINLEAIYLLGDFGVILNGIDKALKPLPDIIEKGDIVTKQLPFYGAGITYKIGRLPEIKEDEKLYVKIDSFDAACVKIKCSDKQKIIAFPPFVEDVTDFAGKEAELEYLLTRRNTFGPLHMNPPTADFYGPLSFLTEGEQFLSNSYSLLRQGMTGDVFFIIKSKK